MWTRLKLKRDSIEFEELYFKYEKVILIINSCKNIDQLESCKKIISNFEAWCHNKGLSQETYTILVMFLEEKLRNKRSAF